MSRRSLFCAAALGESLRSKLSFPPNFARAGYGTAIVGVQPIRNEVVAGALRNVLENRCWHLPQHHEIAEPLKRFSRTNRPIRGTGSRVRSSTQPHSKLFRPRAAGIRSKIGCHSFRATGITTYLKKDRGKDAG
jgi:hypothetical protein